MDEPIEEVYFNWLYSKVAAVDIPTPSLTYWTLFQTLHSIEFVWLVVGDDNRAEDGLEIRHEFLVQVDAPTNLPEMSIGCSVLEMLIALARRAAFNTEIPERDWFWIFTENLGIADLCDAKRNVGRKAYDAVDRFIWRSYSPNGEGGLFPLRNPREDQRKVEIWYQFHEWIAEREIR